MGIFIFLMTLLSASAQDCHYQNWTWSVRERRPVDIKQVSTYRSKLTPEERGTIEGCSVCMEDQTEIQINSITFKVCQRFASDLKIALEDISKSGFPLKEIEAYRVGKSKGSVDQFGKRTEFSHHSYGIAIDINASMNGLYENCPQFSAACKLLRGGQWKPGLAGTITPGGYVVKRMQEMGMKWGGDLAGQQKDFMHFSPTGD